MRSELYFSLMLRLGGVWGSFRMARAFSANKKDVCYCYVTIAVWEYDFCLERVYFFISFIFSDISNSHLFHSYCTHLNRFLIFLDTCRILDMQNFWIYAVRTRLLKLKFILNWQRQLWILIGYIWIYLFLYNLLTDHSYHTRIFEQQISCQDVLINIW